VTNIPSTPSDGFARLTLVPAVADLTAPTLDEVTASSAVQISCYLTPDGWNLQATQDSAPDPRYCSAQDFEKPGRKRYTLSITGIDNTNSENEDDYNALADALAEYSNWVAVERRGLPFDEEFAAGQKVQLTPFQTGMKALLPPETNSVLKATWSTFVTGDVHTDVAIVDDAA